MKPSTLLAAALTILPASACQDQSPLNGSISTPAPLDCKTPLTPPLLENFKEQGEKLIKASTPFINTPLTEKNCDDSIPPNCTWAKPKTPNTVHAELTTHQSYTRIQIKSATGGDTFDVLIKDKPDTNYCRSGIVELKDTNHETGKTLSHRQQIGIRCEPSSGAYVDNRLDELVTENGQTTRVAKQKPEITLDATTKEAHRALDCIKQEIRKLASSLKIEQKQ